MKKTHKILLNIIILLLFSSISVANQLPVGDFSSSNLEAWKEKTFSNSTTYKFVSLQDRVVLMAESHRSASGLFKRTNVDISKYPYLNWSWRIENRLNTGNEKMKSGDDYAARVYVVFDRGLLPWRTKAVNYVWANKSEKHEVWPSAFAGKNSMMVALRNNKDEAATWYYEKRNIFNDLKKIFGKEFKSIGGVAIMTDTDNSNGKATAYYGDIYFSTN